MITYENRKHKHVSPTRKMEMMMELMDSQTIVKTGTCSFGAVTPDGNERAIEKVVPGVWGYGGDSIAVYVDGSAYPATAIIELNIGN